MDFKMASQNALTALYGNKFNVTYAKRTDDFDQMVAKGLFVAWIETGDPSVSAHGEKLTNFVYEFWI